MEVMLDTLYAMVSGAALSLAMSYGLKALGIGMIGTRADILRSSFFVAMALGASRLGTETHHYGLAIILGMALALGTDAIVRRMTA